MGFWNWLVDDVLGIDLPDTDAIQREADQRNADAATRAAAQQAELQAQTAALQESNRIASDAANSALNAQKASIKKSEAALMSPLDSESFVSAAENRQRKLQATSPFGIGLNKKLGAAPTGFRVLSGG